MVVAAASNNFAAICVTLAAFAARIVVVSRGLALSFCVSVPSSLSFCLCVRSTKILFLWWLVVAVVVFAVAGALWYQNAKNKPNLNYNFFFKSSFLTSFWPAFNSVQLAEKNLEAITCGGDAAVAAAASLAASAVSS